MKRILFASLIFLFIGCKSKRNIPDVSNISVHLKVIRFEKDFFSMDTTHLSASLDTLNANHPAFFKDYIFNILGSMPQPDSILQYVASYKKDYQPVYNASQKLYSSFDKYQHEIEKGFQFIQYYFPGYKLPQNIITFIGPIEGTANALTASGIAIGLQGYLGSNFSAYQSQYVSEIYPAYKTRKFAPEYITVNCIKNIVDDMYPAKSAGKPLIEQMIEAGKKLYALDAILPETADTIKTGYTLKQLDGCFKNEKAIWTFYIENNLLYETEPTLIAPYLNDGPNTPELGNDSPAFLGQFTGWQIVKKWMQKNEKISLTQLMQKNEKELFEEAKYKP
jgi:hypothetical protein